MQKEGLLIILGIGKFRYSHPMNIKVYVLKHDAVLMWYGVSKGTAASTVMEEQIL